MKGNPRTLFYVCIVLFGIHQFLEKGMQVRIPLLDNYLDPLLFMPILLHLITAERRFFTKNHTYRLPLLIVIVYVGIASILAELVFPVFNPKLVGDPIDVCLYVLGAGFYVQAQGPRYAISTR